MSRKKGEASRELKKGQGKLGQREERSHFAFCHFFLKPARLSYSPVCDCPEVTLFPGGGQLCWENSDNTLQFRAVSTLHSCTLQHRLVRQLDTEEAKRPQAQAVSPCLLFQSLSLLLTIPIIHSE